MLDVHESGDAPNRAALAGRITTFEQNDHLLAVDLEMPLEFEELHLVGVMFVLLPELLVELAALLAFDFELGAQLCDLVVREAWRLYGCGWGVGFHQGFS